MYAMDLTNPDVPKLLWKRCRGDTDGNGLVFNNINQTWSRPSVGQIEVDRGSGTEIVDVLIFGGGYNGDDNGDNVDDTPGDSTVNIGKDLANRDTNGVTTKTTNAGNVVITRSPQSPSAIGTTDTGRGNVIYILDASNGNIIWRTTDSTAGYDSSTQTFGISTMVDSIPADVGAFDTDGDALIDRIYAGDTGGQIWRVDLVGDNRSNWKTQLLFNAGRHYTCSSGTLKVCDRRFHNRPDLVQTVSGGVNFDAVLIGSGDREDPNETTVENFFYMIKDYGTSVGATVSTLNHDSLGDISDEDCVQSLTNGGCGDPDISSGWRLQLADSGEKSLSASLTISGRTIFTTFTPGGGSSCGLSEGLGRQYVVNTLDATGVFSYDSTNDSSYETFERSDELESGGIPVEAVPLGDDLVLMQGQAAGSNTGSAGSNIQSVGPGGFWKTYWYDTTAN